MEKNQVKFKIGDSVKFKEGTKYWEIPSMDISHWHGRVVEVHLENKRIDVQLDSIVLKGLSDEFIQMCNEKKIYPHEIFVPKTDLEFAEPRDTQEDILRAQDDLIEQIDIVIGESKPRMKYERWIRHFLVSDRFRALDKTDRNNSAFVFNVFYEYMKDYEGRTPARWSADSVRNVLMEWIPRKVTGQKRVFKSFGLIIFEFFNFLDEKGYRKMNALIPVAAEAKDKIVEESQKKEYWGPAKTFMMEAVESGVDIEDQEALNRFTRKKQTEVLEQIANTNLISKLRQTINRTANTEQFKNIKRNQKITVQYPDGTIKENTKFKAVKNDLYEGLCKLIKK